MKLSIIKALPSGDVDGEISKDQSILHASEALGAQVGSACGGVCACSTCHIYVHEGLELLTEASEEEEDILDKAFDVRGNSRLACQAKLRDDIEADSAEAKIRFEISDESRRAYMDEHPDDRN